MRAREKKALAKKVRAAAAYVDRVGLFKGSLYDGEALKAKAVRPEGSWIKAAVENDVPCCTLGVMDGMGLDRIGPDDYLTDHLAKFLAVKHPRVTVLDIDEDGTKVADIAEWNDKPSRRKKDVVDLLTAFADHLEGATADA